MKRASSYAVAAAACLIGVAAGSLSYAANAPAPKAAGASLGVVGRVLADGLVGVGGGGGAECGGERKQGHGQDSD